MEGMEGLVQLQVVVGCNPENEYRCCSVDCSFYLDGFGAGCRWQQNLDDPCNNRLAISAANQIYQIYQNQRMPMSDENENKCPLETSSAIWCEFFIKDSNGKRTHSCIHLCEDDTCGLNNVEEHT